MANKAHEEFTNHDNARTGYKHKCEAFAQATLPSLYRNYHSGVPYTPESELQSAYPASSLPARGITQLASKFSSALVPMTNQPFVGIALRPTDVAEIASNPDDKALYLQSSKMLQDEVYYALSNSNLRDTLFYAFQQLQVFGTCLLRQRKFRFTAHRFDHFVVVRDSEGDPQKIILREYVREENIPDSVKQSVIDKTDSMVKRMDGNFYPLYTYLLRAKDKKTWEEEQYIGDTPVPDTKETYDADAFPYYVPRWKFDPYDNYGVGIVEENYGDILAANATRQTLLESYSIAVSGFIGLKTGAISPSQLSKSKNWAVIPVSIDNQISFIQPQNVAAVNAIEQFDARITNDMRRIFMMDVAAELTHDRTTAFQVAAAAKELNEYSGGILSTFEQSALRPIVMTSIHQLVDEGVLGQDINTLIKDQDIVIEVKSGLQALGRESQQRNVASWLVEIGQTLPGALDKVDSDSYIRWSAAQRGIPDVVLKTPETQDADRQAALQSQLNEALVNQIPETGGRLLEQQAAAQ